ncbi:hypothetical protein BY458DRAFT_438688 [Sporodiniella umbellata]|nr:hypothetical protein BY458DRAFT_438688 [Sporodiniella umbellata]
MPSIVLEDDALHELINIDEIRSSLRQLDEQENQIDASLDNILKLEPQLDRSLNTLSKISPQMDLLKINAQHFINKISETACLAEVISDKVRQLDREQSRAKTAIQYVETVQELKLCINSLNETMAKKDYDKAATLLHNASKIDTSILKGSLAEFTVVYSYKCINPCNKCLLFNYMPITAYV